MNIEIANLVAKDYSVEQLQKKWSLIKNSLDEIQTDNHIVNNYLNLAKNYDLVYAVKEDSTDIYYAFFYFDKQIGKDKKTHLFTLTKVVLDKGFSQRTDKFFIEIINDITEDPRFDYRFQIAPNLNLMVKSLGLSYEENVKIILDRLNERIKAKFDGTEADLIFK